MAHVLRRETVMAQLTGATEVMQELELMVGGSVSSAQSAGVFIGLTAARNQMRIYGSPDPGGIVAEGRAISVSQADFDVAMTHVQRQTALSRSLILTEADPAVIVGDVESPGIFRPGNVVRDADTSAARLAGLMYADLWDESLALMGPVDAGKMVKEATAIIDVRTTQTCQNVNGQIKRFGEPFDLNGWDPRFNDEMMSPPFHWFCRTGVAAVSLDDL